MKRVYVLAATFCLSIFLAVAVNAAPNAASKGANSANGAGKGPKTAVEVPQGVKNSMKVMQAKIDRDKKMHKKQEQGQNGQ